MPESRPFFRCVRPGVDGQYEEGGRWMYVLHPHYAPEATHYLRAFSILQADLLRLFQYVEPADANETTYSYRCLELLLRSCGEVEANCRIILEQNGYGLNQQLNMSDYRKLNPTHRLSSYQVRLPVWTGEHAVRVPFADWATGGSPAWFKAHHGGKHNRHSEFAKASLGNVVDAVAGVVALLSAQFITHDFGPMSRMLSVESGNDGFEQAVGGYFEVSFPTDWSVEQRYDFDWQVLQKDPAPFQQLSF